MKTLYKELHSDGFDELGRHAVPDYFAGQIVKVGYGSKPCYVKVDGKRRKGKVTFGHYYSFVTVPSLASGRSA